MSPGDPIGEAVRLRPDRTALVIVDVQNAFCHPDGTRAQVVGPDAAAPTFEIVPVITGLVSLARRVGLPIWCTEQHYWESDQRAAGRRVGTGLDRAGATLTVSQAGTWDAELVDELATVVDDRDHVLVKHRASAFYQTAFEQQLRMSGVDTLIVTGTTTSYCVEATVRDAHARDFDVVVPADAVADTDPAAQTASLNVIDRFHGLVCTSSDLPRMLGDLG